jgi:hypothetical protein
MLPIQKFGRYSLQHAMSNFAFIFVHRSLRASRQAETAAVENANAASSLTIYR